MCGGGHDYIPMVWDEWLRDPRGKMFVVEVGGVPVGMNRVRFLEDGSAWFEGARVHPDFRRRGLASMLGENSMKFARKKGITVFRLTSGSRNTAAHRQIARIRFEEKARFSVYEPPKKWRVGSEGGATNVRPADLTRVLKLIRNSKEFALGKGMFWHNFAAASLTPGVVRGLISEGGVWSSGGAVAVTRRGGEGSVVWKELCFICGPVQEALGLIGALLGRERKATEMLVFVPQGSPLIGALRKDRFVRHFSMVLFERGSVNG